MGQNLNECWHSYRAFLACDIHVTHFEHTNFLPRELVANEPRSCYLCHTRFYMQALQKQFSISSYNLLRVFFFFWDICVRVRFTRNNTRDGCQAIMEASTIHRRCALEVSCAGQGCQIQHAESPRRRLCVGSYHAAESIVSIFPAPWV